MHKNSLTYWYQTPLGQSLLKLEKAGLTAAMQKMFGYYLLQLGDSVGDELLKESAIHNRFIVSNDNTNFIRCKYGELPFLPQSIDAAVAFHILEFSKNPKTILEEIYNTLIPGGHIIVLCFNPFSLWRPTNWHKHLLAASRLQGWLTKIGFCPVEHKSFYFPLAKKLKFVEYLRQLWMPHAGTSYMIVAQKTFVAVNTVHTKPFTKKVAVAKVLVNKPTSRTQC